MTPGNGSKCQEFYDLLGCITCMNFPKGGGGSGDTVGIRKQNNPNPRELDRPPRLGDGKLDTFLENLN